MERFTTKQIDGIYYINQLSVDNSYVNGFNCYYGKIVDRLAEFENFMEDNDIEEIEELQEIVERDKFEHLITYPFEQKIQALKDRWNKLKEYIVEEFEKDNEKGYVDFACVEEDILNKMQELEKENDDE